MIAADLVAYQKPLYQVLALPLPNLPSLSGPELSAGDILRRACREVPHD